MTHDDLEFYAEVSSRYHRRRAAFLTRLSAMMAITTLFGGATAFATLFGTDTLVAKWLTLGITFLGVIQVVAQIDRNAAIHERWLSDWLSLLYELHVTPAPSDEEMKRFTERFYRLESECVGQMNALAKDCFNQAASALGRQNTAPYRIGYRHRIFMQWLTFENSNFS